MQYCDVMCYGTRTQSIGMNENLECDQQENTNLV